MIVKKHYWKDYLADKYTAKPIIGKDGKENESYIDIIPKCEYNQCKFVKVKRPYEDNMYRLHKPDLPLRYANNPYNGGAL